MASDSAAVKDGPTSGMMEGAQPSSNGLTEDETIKLPGGETEWPDMTAPSSKTSDNEIRLILKISCL